MHGSLGAKKLGHKLVPVHRADNLTPAEIRAYRLADNRTNQETEWDSERLCEELKELMVQDFDMALTCFDRMRSRRTQSKRPRAPRR
jgi:hypothetical protein